MSALGYVMVCNFDVINHIKDLRTPLQEQPLILMEKQKALDLARITQDGCPGFHVVVPIVKV